MHKGLKPSPLPHILNYPEPIKEPISNPSRTLEKTRNKTEKTPYNDPELEHPGPKP